MKDRAKPTRVQTPSYRTHNLNKQFIMKAPFFDKTFRDTQGKIVLFQTPNLPLIIWITASLLNMVFTTGKLNTALDVIAFGALFTWAFEELFQGTNYFRRALGAVVLLTLVVGKLQ